MPLWWVQGWIRLVTLKRGANNRPVSIVSVPHNITAEVATFLASYPEVEGRVFRMTPMNFRRIFYLRAREAGIPKEIAHPHILRHTRAIYLRLSGQEAKSILKDKGFL